ncbi:helix-turn-helix transcriptional regulator [Asanoa sp. WMMD1127]|uniref:helix-turn-helix domain-containing protein n=1 Tax=Asanoa sp. WMMD1127 TaxID=3016107 RepID=UPI002415B243|nr:helix-turn-helix transcriptional regulator [Asanoa sp. WMMD1127]MDG4824889.1 helix-turn-helix transcriptional regulator [Asanoa sp. WMMD1127]
MSGELGPFLRSRREAITPGEVGLPAGRRRRTPGLRRSELATLSGVSVEYLARIEQGTDRRPSLQVLDALADALRLDTDDRALLRLAAKTTAGVRCPRAADPATTVRAPVRQVVDSLDPTPAVLLNRLGDVLAWNPAYAKLMTGLFDDDRPNLVRYLFTDPRAHHAFADWPAVATDQVAALKAAARTDDPHAEALAAELADRPAFTARWSAPPSPTKAPDYEVLELPQDGLRVLVHIGFA